MRDRSASALLRLFKPRPSVYTYIRRAGFSFVREHFHSHRADLFMALMKPAPGASILDVGGGSGDFLARIAQKIPIRGTVAELGRDDSEVRARGFDFVNLEEGTSL